MYMPEYYAELDKEERENDMSAANTHYIRGVGRWMKVLGDPVDNFGKDGKEWVFDLTPDADGKKLLKKLKLDDRIKNKGDDRDDFITMKQRATKMNGEANRPINVVHPDGKTQWDPSNKLGNGTVVDVKFNIKDYGPGKRMGVYPQAIRVLEHVEYAAQDFAPLTEDDKFFAASQETPSEFEQAINNYDKPADDLNDDPFDNNEDEVA